MTTSISKYSMGVGDRFGLEGVAQLRAFQAAKDQGVTITPVWNKSNREHSLIGTRPEDVRAEADAAVKACQWSGPYFVDADHIGLHTVDKFLGASDFFTIDVADSIGKSASDASIATYVAEMQRFSGALRIPGVAEPVTVSPASLQAIAAKYLFAVEEAGRVYRHIAQQKGEGNFVTEVSFDEANTPQTPAELFFILAAAARESDSGGDGCAQVHRRVSQRDRLRRRHQAVLPGIRRRSRGPGVCQATFGLPASLKLSIHSGSDKFSLYPIMHAAIKKAGAGLHLKTAGTTWLEEVIGLAAAGGEGLAFAKACIATPTAATTKWPSPISQSSRSTGRRSRRRSKWTCGAPRNTWRRSNTIRLASASISTSVRWCTSASGLRPKSRRNTSLCSSQIATASNPTSRTTF
jgi:hypothetical protein